MIAIKTWFVKLLKAANTKMYKGFRQTLTFFQLEKG
jgi:hypothetical protein